MLKIHCERLKSELHQKKLGKKILNKKSIVKVKGGSTEYGQRPYFRALLFWDPSLSEGGSLRGMGPKEELGEQGGTTSLVPSQSSDVLASLDFQHILDERILLTNI